MAAAGTERRRPKGDGPNEARDRHDAMGQIDVLLTLGRGNFGNARQSARKWKPAEHSFYLRVIFVVPPHASLIHVAEVTECPANHNHALCGFGKVMLHHLSRSLWSLLIHPAAENRMVPGAATSQYFAPILLPPRGPKNQMPRGQLREYQQLDSQGAPAMSPGLFRFSLSQYSSCHAVASLSCSSSIRVSNVHTSSNMQTAELPRPRAGLSHHHLRVRPPPATGGTACLGLAAPTVWRTSRSARLRFRESLAA